MANAWYLYQYYIYTMHVFCWFIGFISACKTTEVEQHSATPVATPVRKRDADASSVGGSGKGEGEPDVSMKPCESQESTQPTESKNTSATAASAKPEGVLAVPGPKLIGGLTQRQAWFSGNLEGLSLTPTSCNVSIGFAIWLFPPSSVPVFHTNFILHVQCPIADPLKFNLRRAAKARVDRMVKPHGKRTWLNVPEWLREEWRTGSKDQIADVLRDSNFNKDTVEFWLYFWNDPPNSQV